MQVILFLERKPRTLRLREVGKSLLRSGARQHGAGGGAGKKTKVKYGYIGKLFNEIRFAK